MGVHKMRILLLCLVFVTQYSSASFDWSDYSTLLKQNIINDERSGIRTNLVNYDAISKDPAFSSLFERLAAFDPSTLKGKEKMAFYINTYNLFAIKLITDHKPKHSIRDIGTWFSPVWQKPAAMLNANTISLDTIEHKILRKMKEPRIHFAIVCASLSCPDLRIEAYSAKNLDQQLDEQTRRFLANPGKGINIDGEVIYISKIFDWFTKDFAADKKATGILKFIAQYNMEAGRFSDYETLDYNWKLNQQ
tara:strand:- start:3723 stop:4469 length:747 start_codon:yes stop_codon:yes gene_type:complete